MSELGCDNLMSELGTEHNREGGYVEPPIDEEQLRKYS